MNTELETPDTQPMSGAQIIPFKQPTEEYEGPDFGDLHGWIADFMDDVVKDPDSMGRFTYWDIVYTMLYSLEALIREGHYSVDGVQVDEVGVDVVGFADEKLSELLEAAILRLRELPVERHWFHRSERPIEVQS